MSRARTLLQLRTRVRKLADIGPDTTTGRHTNSDVNTMINESWQAMRELVSDNGHELYLKSSTPATMTVGPLTGFSFGTVPVPADCVRIYGIDVTVSAIDIRSLDPATFRDRNQYRDAYGGASGIPVVFHVYNMGVENGASITQGSIALYPAPDRAYTYVIWYLPSWTDITSDTNVFDGMVGWDDWVCWDCVTKLAAADNDMATTYAIAQQERDQAKQRMLKGANAVQRVGPTQRMDIAGRQRTSRFWSVWRRPTS